MQVKHEKSCGAVIYQKTEEKTLYCLIKQVQGHISFPKGHVEADETEHMTSAREIKEETGIDVCFIDGFRTMHSYSPKEGIEKEVILFLAEKTGGEEMVQKGETVSIMWFSAEEALQKLTYEADREILLRAENFLKDLEND